jgi:hypothetical protein
MVRTLEYCSVNWQVRTYTWFPIVMSGIWFTSRQYFVQVPGPSFGTPVTCLDARLANGEKPIMAFGRVLASGKRLARMADLSRQRGSRRPLLLRRAVLFSSGALVFLLGSCVPKSEQPPLGPFDGVDSSSASFWCDQAGNDFMS